MDAPVLTALVTLASSIIGGSARTRGQFFARRAEDRRHWKQDGMLQVAITNC